MYFRQKKPRKLKLSILDVMKISMKSLAEFLLVQNLTSNNSKILASELKFSSILTFIMELVVQFSCSFHVE